MKEALPVVLDYGFNIMGLKRVEAFLSLENEASLRLIKSFGFKEEGSLREHYFTGGHMEDSSIFSLLLREYETQPWRQSIRFASGADVL